MKQIVVVMLALLAGCGGSQHAAEDTKILAQARQLEALTKGQVHVRQQIVDNAHSLPDPSQREIDRLELENAQARLAKWFGEFEAAQKESDEVKLEQPRRDFVPMMKRLRNG